ncbi:putative 2-oxoglutarate/Fe(II)-dependent dioxygenase YbiX [Devosia sp. UYZn731]|uniref:2OG-Fe(II) oxygenase n=1 Tax=Devosia sp. UYZn731 TaxID=3156345 RepID=UPI00339AB786
MSILNVGEPAPWFSVPRSDGGGHVVLDELAGRDIVLLVYGALAGPDAQRVLDDFLQHDETFGTGQAILIGLSLVAGSLPAHLAGKPGWYFGHDIDGSVGKRYGVDDPGAVTCLAFVLSPALQVIEIVSDAEQIAARVLPLLEARRAHRPQIHDAPVLIVPGVFDADFCAGMIAMYEAEGGREIGAIETAGKVVEKFDPAFRKRLDWYVSDEQTVQQCRDLLVRRLLPIIHRAFQFRTTRIERYLVGCYEAANGGHFHAHRDNTAPLVAHRRFAVTLNLNEAYEGGSLRFPEFGPKTYRAGVGSAVVFSCSLLHEVTPLISGTRYAFLSFLYDEEAQRIREEHANRMAASAQAHGG